MKRVKLLWFIPVLLILLIIFLWVTRPVDPSITIDGLSEKLGRSGSIKVQFDGDISISSNHYNYYEVCGSDELLAYFRPETWKKVSSPNKESQEIVAAFVFGELYGLYLYSDGSIEACDGYGRFGYKDDVCYSSGEIDLQAIINYVTENGEFVEVESTWDEIDALSDALSNEGA